VIEATTALQGKHQYRGVADSLIQTLYLPPIRAVRAPPDVHAVGAQRPHARRATLCDRGRIAGLRSQKKLRRESSSVRQS
jgi:hypothetical protein